MGYTGTEVILLMCMVAGVAAVIPVLAMTIHDLRKPPPVEVDAETLRRVAGQLERLSTIVARMAESPEPPKTASEESRGSPPGTPRAWASR